MRSVVNVSTPVANPVTGSTVNIVGSAVVHVPPDGLLVYKLELKLQNASLPMIGVGSAFTVTVTVLAQPVEMKPHVIVAVPTDTLVTNPVVGSTVATAVFPLLHVTPGLVQSRSVVKPIHTVGLPVIALGSAFTVISLVLTQPIPCV